MFVGVERQRVIDDLLASFERVSAGEGSRMVCLVAPPGVGKTRLVQEFYREMAGRQPDPGYWPRRLGDSDADDDVAGLLRARKRVFPSRVEVPDGATMPWMWWGLLCNRREDGEFAQVLWDDSTQLYGHASGLISARNERLAAAASGFDVSTAVIEVLGLLGLAVAPPLGVALTVSGAVKAGWDQRGLAARLKKWRDSRNEQAVDAVGHGRGSELQELVEGLAQVSRKVPLVIVVDDAHCADTTLIEVIDQLLGEPGARVLVMATTWPHALDGSTGLEPAAPTGSDGRLPFARWWQSMGSATSQRVCRVDLAPLSDSDMAELIAAEIPTLSVEASAALMDHVWHNPLVARVLLRTERIRHALSAESFAAEDLVGVPRKLEEALAAYWDEMPLDVRSMLARAAQLGVSYLPAPVVAAATAQGIQDAESALAKGVDPYAWAQDLDENLQQFIEPAMREIARRAGLDELLTSEDIAAVHSAFIERVLTADEGTFCGRASETALSQHVALASEGLVPTDSAARSARRLAVLHANRCDYPTAIRLTEQALRWTSTNPDSADTMITRGNLAYWLGRVGRTEEAYDRFAALLEDQTRILGGVHPDTLTTRNDLAVCLGESGRVREAIDRLRVLLEDQTCILGPHHQNTLTARSDLARWLGESGQVGEAAEQFAALLDDQIRGLGADHPHTLGTRGNLAFCLGRSGRAEEAVEQFRVLLEDQTRVLGGDHPNTLGTRNNLAFWLGESGRAEEAYDRLAALLEDQTRVLGGSHPHTLATLGIQAFWLGRVGRTEEAIGQLAVLFDDQTRLLGADHPNTLATHHALAVCLARVGWVEEAID